jgi:hypothetical protein
METGNSRYPGTSPFSDTELSRKTFFGRPDEAIALNNQIIANRLVLVYAKSGVGKTSLIKAGVMHSLRKEGYLPFVVRLNVEEKDSVGVVDAALRYEAAKKKYEMVTEKVTSLWGFFKTVEIWKGDNLITPIMIFDQFEELFTKQSYEFRKRFIEELSALTRKYPPRSEHITEEITKKVHKISSPPHLRIVLSIREDFLGALEEAAETIPHIFSCRFRLTPLSKEKAIEALLAPAKIEDDLFMTKPFDIDESTVDKIINFLSEQMKGGDYSRRVNVEPFQLQLLCLKIEELAYNKQQKDESKITINIEDLGGTAGLTDILKEFYRNILMKIPGIRTRRAVKKLCESKLITVTGRRNSIDKEQIISKYKIGEDILDKLVKERLLRSDQRANNTFYELSHDSLVKPILASRQLTGSLYARLRIYTGIVLSAIGLILSIGSVLALITLILENARIGVIGVVAFVSVALVFLFTAYSGVTIFRRGKERLQRLKLVQL